MHVLLFADGRSPHTVGWARGMTSIGLDVSILSSRTMSGRHLRELEQAVRRKRIYAPHDIWNLTRPRVQQASSALRKSLRTLATSPPETPPSTPKPLDKPRLVDKIDLRASAFLTGRLRDLVRETKADAVHALRVQVEGIAASRLREVPLAISTWGQDLSSRSSMGEDFERPTGAAMSRTDVLFADCERDVQLAASWGLRGEVPRYCIPGNFGVSLENFPGRDETLMAAMGVKNPLVLYPRGLRSFVNYQGFADATTTLLRQGVSASFIGVGLEGAVVSPSEYGTDFRCTKTLPHAEMLRLVACADVLVSPAWSDGMPNSVLEGMAAGAIPVCGNLDSLRELEAKGARIAWCDASSSTSIAAGIRSALAMSEDPRNREANRRIATDYYSTAAARKLATEAYSDLESLI